MCCDLEREPWFVGVGVNTERSCSLLPRKIVNGWNVGLSSSEVGK